MNRGGRPTLSDDAVEERREAILAAALDQISERGTASMRLKDVARSANVSVGTIQYYFDTRDALVLAAYHHHSQIVIARVEASYRSGLSPWPSLKQTLHDFVHVENFTTRTRLWLEFVAATNRDEALRPLLITVFNSWKQVIRNIVAAGIADGTFQPAIDQETAIEALLAQLDGFEIAYSTGAFGTNPDRIEYVLCESARALLSVDNAATKPRVK